MVGEYGVELELLENVMSLYDIHNSTSLTQKPLGQIIDAGFKSLHDIPFTQEGFPNLAQVWKDSSQQILGSVLSLARRYGELIKQIEPQYSFPMWSGSSIKSSGDELRVSIFRDTPESERKWEIDHTTFLQENHIEFRIGPQGMVEVFGPPLIRSKLRNNPGDEFALAYELTLKSGRIASLSQTVGLEAPSRPSSVYAIHLSRSLDLSHLVKWEDWQNMFGKKYVS